jgi:hypothetical protein
LRLATRQPKSSPLLTYLHNALPLHAYDDLLTLNAKFPNFDSSVEFTGFFVLHTFINTPANNTKQHNLHSKSYVTEKPKKIPAAEQGIKVREKL